MLDIQISNYILNLHSYINNNKWRILFIIFGVLIAYALGKKFGLKNENFNDKNQNEDFHSGDEKSHKDDMINKAIDRGVKNIKAEPIVKRKEYKSKCRKVDLKQYVHKSLVPDIDDYVTKDHVERHYISKKDLDKRYMLKKNCKPEEIDYTKYISKDDVKNYYVSKSSFEKKYMKKEDCDCYGSDDKSDEQDIIQKVEVKRTKKVIEVPEIVYKKVKVEVDKPQIEENIKLIKKSPEVKKEKSCLKIKRSPKKSPRKLPVIKTAQIIIKKSPKKKSKCNSPTLIKQQTLLNKNRLDMNDNYSKVDDPYTYCNAKSCIINGFPNGISTSNE